jgi:hypothetical protein
MAIHRLLQQSAFGPGEIQILISAYEECLEVMKPALAKRIIEVAQTGIRNPAQIRRAALDQMGFTLK